MDIKLGQNPLINSGYKYMLLYHPDRVQDFIAQLLMRNARHRLSAAQCMEHPWLMERDIGTEVGDTPSCIDIQGLIY